jgi:two-component system sensor histidine kinase KdpD
VLQWQLSDPRDALALTTYLITALVITRLAANARNEAFRAESKRKEVKLLYDVASRLLALEPDVAAGAQALRIFRETFHLNAACLFEPAAAGLQMEGTSYHGLAEATREAYVREAHRKGSGDSSNEWVHVRCLEFEGKPAGAIGFEGRLENKDALLPLFALAGTAFERTQSFRAAGKAAAAAEAEMLRSVILDAFAHEFKTPQAVIMTAAGTLRETGGLRAEQLELTDLIEDEVCRMSRITTGLLRMARVAREDLKPNLELTGPAELLRHVIAQYRRHGGDRSISLQVKHSAPVMTDPELIRLALVQLIDNAYRYSPPGSPVSIEVDSNTGFAEVLVSSEGDSILPEETERIFERSYRGANSKNTSAGTGLGLYVARKIVGAHGGDLDLCRGQSPEGITTFRIRLPIAQGECSR